MASECLVALSDSFACIQNNHTHTTTTVMYAYAYKNATLTGKKMDILDRVGGAECITTKDFNGPMIVRSYPMSNPVSKVKCAFAEFSHSLPGDEQNRRWSTF